MFHVIRFKCNYLWHDSKIASSTICVGRCDVEAALWGILIIWCGLRIDVNPLNSWRSIKSETFCYPGPPRIPLRKLPNLYDIIGLCVCNPFLDSGFREPGWLDFVVLSAKSCRRFSDVPRSPPSVVCIVLLNLFFRRRRSESEMCSFCARNRSTWI